jgi:hypothetical protein
VTLVIDQLLLLGSLVALAAASWRVAALGMPTGLLRVLAAISVGATVAVSSALVLGLIGLGASPPALALAAIAAWATAQRWVTVAAPKSGEQLRAWWSGLTPAGRIARAALAGAFLGYLVWLLRHPAIGFDALADHLALPVAWVHNGRPGSVVAVNDGLPFAYFPNVHEVLVTWLTGLARTLVPQTLLTPGALVLLGVSVRAGLARMEVPPLLSWLAVGVVTTIPLVVVQIGGPNTDLPGMAWLACTAALAAGASRQPRLLAFAVLAAGLAVGTKTTTVPLTVLSLALAAWSVRDALRREVVLLLSAFCLAVLTGGFWYLRALFEHGSPLWPLSSTSWGDPVPPGLRAIEPSFLAHIRATLHGRLGGYGRALAGGLVVVAGAVLAPLWVRRRSAVWGALVAVVAVLIWATSPYTGNWTSTQLALGATRYLLPSLLAATVAVALAGRFAGTPALAVLGLAFAINLDRSLRLGYPATPALAPVALGAALAAGLTVAAPRLGRAVRMRGAAAAALAALGLVGALGALLVPVHGYLEAHAGTGEFDSALVRWFNGREQFRSGHQPIVVGPVDVAMLAGVRLAHPLYPLGSLGGCAGAIQTIRRGWVVLEQDPSAPTAIAAWQRCLAGHPPVFAAGGFIVYSSPALARPAS